MSLLSLPFPRVLEENKKREVQAKQLDSRDTGTHNDKRRTTGHGEEEQQDDVQSHPRGAGTRGVSGLWVTTGQLHGMLGALPSTVTRWTARPVGRVRDGHQHRGRTAGRLGVGMRCLELFAGAGGAALGLERAGFTHTALVERDRDACATLRAAGLGPVVEGDVRDLSTIEAVAGRDCDLLWSSFPCQAWSHAGKRLGAEDDRNGWPWTVDAIDHFRPTWFLAENVRGILSTDYFDGTIMAQLGERFRHIGHWILDAADFGVPQHRRRVFIWAGPSPLVPPTRTHGPGMFTGPWVTMGDALDLRSDEVLHHMRNTEAHPTQERPTPSTEPSPTIGGKGNQFIDRPAPTVTTADGQGVGSADSRNILQRTIGRRRLTVEECATLQGFPVDHPWQGTKTSRYRQVGNAVPPALAFVVGCQVVENAHHVDAFINRRECP